MPGPAMPGIDEAGVTAVGVGEGTSEPVFVRRNDDQMDMVRHQAIGPDRRPRAPRRFGQQVTVEREIAILEKELLAAVAALGDVIRNAG